MYRSSSGTVTRKTHDFDSQRATQYRNRVSDVKIPSDLCNGSEWDSLSHKIWAKFDERRQPQEMYEKKILLWVNLCQQIKVKKTRVKKNHVEHSIFNREKCVFFFDCRQYFHGIVCIWLVQRCLVSLWIRPTLICVLFPVWIRIWIIVLNRFFIWINWEPIYRHTVVSDRTWFATTFYLPNESNDKVIVLYSLSLRIESFLQNFNLIPAKVPILRFDDVHNSFEVDLNYNNCVGIRNSHLLYCYTQCMYTETSISYFSWRLWPFWSRKKIIEIIVILVDWRLQPLAVIVKLWAQHHDINNAKDLTISSYSLILMVIHYLQFGVQPAILPCLHALYPDKFNVSPAFLFFFFSFYLFFNIWVDAIRRILYLSLFTSIKWSLQKINDIETYNINDKMEPYHSDNKQTLGELFFGFLEYYCNFKWVFSVWYFRIDSNRWLKNSRTIIFN